MQSMSPFLLRLTMCGAAAVFAGGFLFAEASDEPGTDSSDINATTSGRDPAYVHSCDIAGGS